jgi:hypothetical protein
MKQKASLLMGATGLVGCECLKLLTDDTTGSLSRPGRRRQRGLAAGRSIHTKWTLSESAMTGIF